jgi:hypothetical protein
MPLEPYPPVYGQAPFPAVTSPAARASPHKRRIWPFAFAASLVVVILGAGTAVAFNLYGSFVADQEAKPEAVTKPDSYDDLPIDPPGDGYLDDYPDDYPDDPSDGDTWKSGTYTLDEIKERAGVDSLPNTNVDGVCSPGLFEVGQGKDIEAGLYYFEGSPSVEGQFLRFKRIGTTENYTLESYILYFGHYFCPLNEGETVVFLTPTDAHMRPAPMDPLTVGDTITSGCYRVGIDIPAGTYKASIQPDLPLYATQNCGVYVMEDLLFDYGSIVDACYFYDVGEYYTVNLEEGQYVELYLAVMVKVSMVV